MLCLFFIDSFFTKVIDNLTKIIEVQYRYYTCNGIIHLTTSQESGNLIDSSLKAPAIYLRACSKFAIGKCLEVSIYAHYATVNMMYCGGKPEQY